MSEILEENQGEEIEMSRKDANQLIPSIESAYYGLQIRGKYLPKITSSIITAEYLLGVLFEKYYVPETQDVKIGVILRPKKKYEILEELMKQQLEGDQQLGIDLKHQPDKLWAINVLKTLNPNHQLFKKYSPEKFDMKNFTQNQLMLIKQMDFSQGKKSQVRRFFRVSKEKQQEIQLKKKQEQKKQLQKKMNRKNLIIQEIQKEVQSIGAQIQQQQHQ